ncbi:MAG: M20/M25/M40 family metallo-hydrolase [Gemmatimonadetes bacterium]|nr:M20/M25/M40 family metallo-hydrolase [Gemmatimonadota bacterium]
MTPDAISTSITSGRVTELISGLVSIPSVTGSEQALGDMLHGHFEEIGLSDVRRIPVEDSGDSLAVRIPGRGNGRGHGRAFMLNFHQDTFDACDGWETDPWSPVVRDGCVYGLGAHDMKAGAAAVLAAVEAIVRSGVELAGDLIVSATTDEENWSRGAHALIGSGLLAGCAGCLIPEPTPPGRLRVGSRGRHVIKVDLAGRTAHAAYTGEGVNAVHDAATIITALNRIELGWNEEYELGGTICVIEISGGRNLILVPEHAQVVLDRHILPGQSIDQAARDLEALIRSLSIESQWRVTWDDRPTPAPAPYIVDPDSKFVQSTRKRVEEQLGRPVRYALARSVADTNHFAVTGGIPTLVYGPEGGNTCQANEYVSIESTLRVARAYCGIVVDMLGLAR